MRSLNEHINEKMNFKINSYPVKVSKLLKHAMSVYEIVDYLDKIPEFKKFKKSNADYDDVFYKIPVDIWKEHIGWDEDDIEYINDRLENEEYAGSIHHMGKFIEILGGE